MEPTPNPDAPSAKSDRVLLRAEVYDALAGRKGLDTRAKQAARHGISAAHMSLIYNGRKGLGLSLALRIAADLGTSVEALTRRAS